MPLSLEINGDKEFWDPIRNEFISCKKQKITLEHSLISISRWESKWHIPFLDSGLSTQEQLIDYIKCMCVSSNVDPMVFYVIAASPDLIKIISDYIADPMTATWFSEDQRSRYKKEKITSEIIYYLMISYGIPSEYEKWHLNRLLTLIRVCAIKNEPTKKMGINDVFSQNRALNAARRAAMKSRG